MRVMGIDYGTKRIGVAVSDESQTLAREYNIYQPKEFWNEIKNIIEKEGVERIVIGLPLNMSGEKTDKTNEVQAFTDELQELVNIPLEFMDERLSSVMAENLPGGRENIDSLAAQIILQNYLDKNKK